jgi:hypothetical protein
MTSPTKTVVLPTKGPLLSRTGWSAFMMALIAVCAVAPVLNIWVPESSMFHMSTYAVALLGKIMCYAICALAMDLIWGYRHFVVRAWPVFCVGWLYDGHVLDAPDWDRWQLQKQSA